MAARIETVVSKAFAQNAYILYRDGSPDALVVDPGFDPEAILTLLRRRGLTPSLVINTHGHSDHIAGNAALKAAYPTVPLIIGHGDAAALTDPMLNLSALFGEPITSPPADRTVCEGDQFTAAGLAWTVREIPGHSPGHVVFIADEPGWVLGGDVLFAGSIGRTDFPNGSLEQLLSGIRSKLWPLPDATIVYPGHGVPTTIGAEKRSNPYLAEQSDG